MRSLPRLRRHAGLLVTGAILLTAAAGTADAAPPLWRLSDADTTIHLFGTVHMLRADMDWRTPALDAALGEADALWVEVPDLDDRAGIVPLIGRYGFDFATPLSSLLTQDERAKLDAAARLIGGSAAMLDAARPWYAAMQIGLAPLLAVGYDPNMSVDATLVEEARAAGTPIAGFESAEQQVRFFADLSPELELDLLRQTLEDYENAATELNAQLEAWLAGDFAPLGTALEEERAASAALYDLLLRQRNATWVDDIADLLDKPGSFFVAAGAAHFIGPDSLLALLEARGLAPERVQ